MYGRFQGRCRSCDRPSDRISGSVPLPDLGQAIADTYRLAVRASRHVAVDEGLRQAARRWPELADQVTGETPFLGFCQGT